MKKWFCSLVVVFLAALQVPAAATISGTTEEEFTNSLKQMVKEADDATLVQLLAAINVIAQQYPDENEALKALSGKDAAAMIEMAQTSNKQLFDSASAQIKMIPVEMLRAQLLADDSAEGMEEDIEADENADVDEVVEEVEISGKTPEEVAQSLNLATQLLSDEELIAFADAIDALEAGKTPEEIEVLLVGETPSTLVEKAAELKPEAAAPAIDAAAPEKVEALRKKFLPTEPVKLDTSSQALSHATFLAMVRQADDAALVDLMTSLLVLAQSGISEEELNGLSASDLVAKAKDQESFARFHDIIGQQPAQQLRSQLLGQ